jgi:hypothetical protein
MVEFGSLLHGVPGFQFLLGRPKDGAQFFMVFRLNRGNQRLARLIGRGEAALAGRWLCSAERRKCHEGKYQD